MMDDAATTVLPDRQHRAAFRVGRTNEGDVVPQLRGDRRHDGRYVFRADSGGGCSSIGIVHSDLPWGRLEEQDRDSLLVLLNPIPFARKREKFCCIRDTFSALFGGEMPRVPRQAREAVRLEVGKGEALERLNDLMDESRFLGFVPRLRA